MSKVTALIFAGGTGQRMSTRATPKQFLELHGKPVIIYTIEHFERHAEVDSIVVVCLESWIPELKRLLRRYDIEKVTTIVPGGVTGHASIYNGLLAMRRAASDRQHRHCPRARGGHHRRARGGKRRAGGRCR
jgi:2-C-methyl-D-erythritol 4-phosphate cytidylyltransferase